MPDVECVVLKNGARIHPEVEIVDLKDISYRFEDSTRTGNWPGCFGNRIGPRSGFQIVTDSRHQAVFLQKDFDWYD